ncbi:MAG: hypothetical protein JXA42_23615 [Anaerolineales bacterium]|nr:hypothetical protein [Anaerolineales bacterium]
MDKSSRSKSGESKSWLFMRGSGFLMPTLVLGHLIIQHLLNDVHNLKVEWVVERWDKTGWRIWDGLMLLLAVGHGLNGTRYVIDDYVHDPALNRTIMQCVGVLGVLLVAAGLAGLIAFDKDTAIKRLK